MDGETTNRPPWEPVSERERHGRSRHGRRGRRRLLRDSDRRTSPDGLRPDGPTQLFVGGLLAILAVATLFVAGRHGWTRGVIELLAFGLGIAWLVRSSRPSAHVPRSFVVAAVALLVYVGFQTIPLPRGVLGVLSPNAADLYSRTVDRVVEPAGEGGPRIRPPGPEPNEIVPAETRASIHDLARERPPVPSGWRSIALHPANAKSDFLLYAACGILLWLAAAVPAPARLLRGIVAVGVVVAVVAAVQFASGTDKVLWIYDSTPILVSVGGSRLQGPFLNTDHLAVFLEMTLFAAAGLLLATRTAGPAVMKDALFLRRVVLTLALAVLLAAILGTASRGALAAVASGGAVLAWGTARGSAGKEARRRRRRGSDGRTPHRTPHRRAAWLASARRFAVPTLVVAIVVGALVFAGHQARETLDRRLLHATESEDLGFGLRFDMWRQTVPMIRDFPLVGVGAGNWREAIERYRRFPYLGTRPNHAHGDYLEWISETGLVGLLLTIALGIAYVRWARRNDGIPPGAQWGLVAAVAAVGVHEVAEFGLRKPANPVLLASVLGLLVNRHWHAAPGEDDRPRQRSPWQQPVAVGVFLMLVFGAAGEIRDFRTTADAWVGKIDAEAPPRTGEAWYAIGRRLHDLGYRYEPATREAFRKAALLHPTHARAFWRLALNATRFEEREVALAAAVHLRPIEPEWHIRYAFTLDLLGRRRESLARIEDSVYRVPRLDDHRELLTLDHPGKEQILEAMHRGVERALAERSGDPFLLRELARLEQEMERWAVAGERWESLARTTDEWKRYGVPAARAYAKAEAYDDAEGVLRRVIRDDPRAVRPYRVLAHDVLATTDRLGEAREVLETALGRARETWRVYESLYQLLWRAGDRDEAVEALAEAADRRPWNARLQERLGRAYLDLGNHHLARSTFRRAIEVDGERARSHYLYGVAAERLYDFRDARSAYAKATRLDPENRTYAARLEKIEEILARDRGS